MPVYMDGMMQRRENKQFFGRWIPPVYYKIAVIELQKRVRNPGAIMHPAIHRELKTCQANLKVVEAKYMTLQFHFFQILIPLCMARVHGSVVEI